MRPILFVIYKYDVIFKVKLSKISLFADENNIDKAIEKKKSVLELQSDLHTFNKLCVLNGLEFNVEKCCSICFGKPHDISCIYTLSDEHFKRVSNVKDLGLIIDSKPLLKNHYEHVDMKFTKKIAFITKFTQNFWDVSTFKWYLLKMSTKKCPQTNVHTKMSTVI